MFQLKFDWCVIESLMTQPVTWGWTLGRGYDWRTSKDPCGKTGSPVSYQRWQSKAFDQKDCCHFVWRVRISRITLFWSLIKESIPFHGSWIIKYMNLELLHHTHEYNILSQKHYLKLSYMTYIIIALNLHLKSAFWTFSLTKLSQKSPKISWVGGIFLSNPKNSRKKFNFWPMKSWFFYFEIAPEMSRMPPKTTLQCPAELGDGCRYPERDILTPRSQYMALFGPPRILWGGGTFLSNPKNSRKKFNFWPSKSWFSCFEISFEVLRMPPKTILECPVELGDAFRYPQRYIWNSRSRSTAHFGPPRISWVGETFLSNPKIARKKLDFWRNLIIEKLIFLLRNFCWSALYAFRNVPIVSTPIRRCF